MNDTDVGSSLINCALDQNIINPPQKVNNSLLVQLFVNHSFTFLDHRKTNHEYEHGLWQSDNLFHNNSDMYPTTFPVLEASVDTVGVKISLIISNYVETLAI